MCWLHTTEDLAATFTVQGAYVPPLDKHKDVHMFLYVRMIIIFVAARRESVRWAIDA